jgi:hypothetical protein
MARPEEIYEVVSELILTRLPPALVDEPLRSNQPNRARDS